MPANIAIITLSLHDALPISLDGVFHIHHTADLPTDFFTVFNADAVFGIINKHPEHGLMPAGTKFNAPEFKSEPFHYRSEEHTSELQSRPQLVWRRLLGRRQC